MGGRGRRFAVFAYAPKSARHAAAASGITEVLGAPVLDTIALAAKTAEMQVSLWRAGLRPARRIGAFQRPLGGWANPAFEALRDVFRLGD